MDLKKLLGKRIKFLRTKYDMTQEQLSEAVGISQRTLSAIECGRSFVTSKTLEDTAKALNISVEEIFKTDYLKPTGELIKEIQDELKRANKEKIELIYKFIKSLD